jgi:excisionase family DNA binding protein
MTDDFITMREAVDLVGRTQETIGLWCSKGKIRNFKEGREWRIDPEDLKTYAAERKAHDEGSAEKRAREDDLFLEELREVLLASVGERFKGKKTISVAEASYASGPSERVIRQWMKHEMVSHNEEEVRFPKGLIEICKLRGSYWEGYVPDYSGNGE